MRLPRIRLHDVRHTYATVSLDAGVNPKIVSERIGHASLAFTLQVYTHRSEGRDREAAQTIAALIVPRELTQQTMRENRGRRNDLCSQTSVDHDEGPHTCPV